MDDLVAVEKEPPSAVADEGAPPEVEVDVEPVLKDDVAVDMEVTQGAAGTTTEPNYSTVCEFCDRRIQPQCTGLHRAMGCKDGVCVVCSTKVGNNGASSHYRSHGYAWYCSCGFGILSRDGVRAHPKTHAPQLVKIYAVSPRNDEALEKESCTWRWRSTLS